MNEPSVDLALAIEHGLSSDEYDLIKSILKRTPTFVELGIFSVMWSEHCSYKSSIKMLKTLPRSGGRMLVEAGEENAGLIDIGNNRAVSFKIESHNHPSAVEPYEGAATGVGGILRDIFTMGARPIACLNSLRFGSLDNERNRFLLEHVVAGIGDYGNCVGIPTVGGEVVIEDSYSGNPLVNAMTVGIVNHDHVISATAYGVGNPVFLVGSTTGRDGVHGATFASVELTEESESNKSNVQVGDPFTEKLLLEASLELGNKSWLIGMQDMGAAGITCSSAEMTAKGKSGITLFLNKVKLRENDMSPYEIMLSESQERMLVVIKKGFEKELIEIFDKWDLDCTEIGVINDKKNVEVIWNEKVIADIPSNSLVLGGDAPQYDMKYETAKYFSDKQDLDLNTIQEPNDYNDVLLKLLSAPNITNKKYVYEQYDSTVRTNTMQGPGGDAGVFRIKDTEQALAACTDCNGRYVYLDPREGGKIAVAEAARNVVCSGAEPIAITNCLNFGNPQDPEIYWQFREAVLGMGDACRAFNTPVTGGNVSFYNESDKGAVYPSPVIGMLGLLDHHKQKTTIEFKNEGDFIVIIGSIDGKLGGSEYLKTIHKKIIGPIPTINLEFEYAVQKVCLNSIKEGIINSAHDISDGGLATTIAESFVYSKNNLGVKLDLNRKSRNDELLFGECQSSIVVSIPEDKLLDLINVAKEFDVPTQTIGKVTKENIIEINDLISLSKEEVKDAYFNSFETIMKQ